VSGAPAGAVTTKCSDSVNLKQTDGVNLEVTQDMIYAGAFHLAGHDDFDIAELKDPDVDTNAPIQWAAVPEDASAGVCFTVNGTGAAVKTGLRFQSSTFVVLYVTYKTKSGSTVTRHTLTADTGSDPDHQRVHLLRSS
jgi:hypothetical protein